jgi:DNA-binding NtrC family response regulator
METAAAMPKQKDCIKIVVVDRDMALFHQTRNVFPKDQTDVSVEKTLEHAFEKFEECTFDILILTGTAFKFQIGSTIELLEIIANQCAVTQVLILVYPKELPLAFSALKAGSYQYAKLPISDEELRLLVETALVRRPQSGLNMLLKAPSEKPGFEDMVGRSPRIQDVYRQIRQAAQTDIPVLITGDTGTGKELVARAIHQLSDRREKPFVPIHLGALPLDLVSSELFGHDKGAFTGATKTYKGSFERAKGGTVLLDEIGTIDEQNQVSLLRLLETKRFQRIGGTRDIRANVRVLAASNEDLDEAIRQGRFREDLFYRLDVFPITLPSVCDRAGDISLIVDHFLKHYNKIYQTDIRGVSPECINRLESYAWPGNVREIKNVIHRAVVMCSGGVLLPEHLPKRFSSQRNRPPTVSIQLGSSLKEAEKKMIARTLEWANNNRQRAAAILGISRRTLYNKISKYHL